MLCHAVAHSPYNCCAPADVANCVGVAAILLLLYAGKQRHLKESPGASPPLCARLHSLPATVPQGCTCVLASRFCRAIMVRHSLS